MKKILLITSDEEFKGRLCSAGEKRGYKIAATANGTNALHILKDENCGVIIADTLCGEMPPFSLLHRLNLVNISVPVIVVTDEPDADDIFLSCDLGAYDIINKKKGEDEILNQAEEAC